MEGRNSIRIIYWSSNVRFLHAVTRSVHTNPIQMEHPKKMFPVSHKKMEKTSSLHHGSTTVYFHILGCIPILFCKTLWKLTSISKHHKQNFALEFFNSWGSCIHFFVYLFVCPRISTVSEFDDQIWCQLWR